MKRFAIKFVAFIGGILAIVALIIFYAWNEGGNLIPENCINSSGLATLIGVSIGYMCGMSVAFLIEEVGG